MIKENKVNIPIHGKPEEFDKKPAEIDKKLEKTSAINLVWTPNPNSKIFNKINIINPSQ